MKNSFWYRYFLICNQLANKVMGHEPQNFALLMIEEQGGRFMNKQMTCYFYAIDDYLSELMSNDSGTVFEELDMDELAELSMEQITQDFEEYCNGRLKIDFTKED